MQIVHPKNGFAFANSSPKLKVIPLESSKVFRAQF